MKAKCLAHVLLAASLAATGSALAAEDLSGQPGPQFPSAGALLEGEQTRPAAAGQGAFGLQSQDFWVAATEFHPRQGTRLDYDAFAYYYAATGTGNQVFDAKIDLPAGARVTLYDCFVYDTNATANVSVNLWKQFHDFGPNTPGNVQLGALASTGTSGFQAPAATAVAGGAFVPFTVQYREGFLRNLYTFILFLEGSTPTTAFRNCRLFWHRQISPAPAAAAFTDVPTSHPFFQFIEALRASAITLGCTATEFCPDAPVTRAQMAAFLARMGGLHWPF